LAECPDTVIPDFFWVDSRSYGRGPFESRPKSYYAIDPAPLAALVAAVLGFRDDLLECMKAIAEDDQDGPIHLVRLIAACEAAASDVHGGLPTDSWWFENQRVSMGEVITASVSPQVLPSLVRAMHSGGFVEATALARTYTRRDRFRALDVLVHYVAAPIVNLQINLSEDRIVRAHEDGPADLDDDEKDEASSPPARLFWTRLRGSRHQRRARAGRASERQSPA
jgi:hypothetical protein